MTENNIWLRRRRSPRSEVELDAWVTERDAWLAERAKEVGSDLERIRATNVCEERSRKRATTIPPPEDEKEGARGTVRSACVAAQQRFLRSSGNPIHIWEAIWMCTNPAVAPMPLPDWCIAYLHKAAEGLLQASGDGEKLAIFIAVSSLII